eukprot:9052509-Pyramimonas_sp.AAC.2
MQGSSLWWAPSAAKGGIPRTGAMKVEADASRTVRSRRAGRTRVHRQGESRHGEHGVAPRAHRSN